MYLKLSQMFLVFKKKGILSFPEAMKIIFKFCFNSFYVVFDAKSFNFMKLIVYGVR